MDKDDRCENCEYWKTHMKTGSDERVPFGECHRRAPTGVVAGNRSWATTAANDFCGDHQRGTPRTGPALGLVE